MNGCHILGDWPGLENEQLYEGRDFSVTTYFRDVFAQLVSGHLGAEHLDRVFPDYGGDPTRYRGVLRQIRPRPSLAPHFTAGDHRWPVCA